MNLRDLPRWLARDVIAFFGLLMGLLSYERTMTATVARMESERRRWFEPEEFALLARLLAVAESWLRYTIERRAFRLTGLNHRRVRRIEPTPVTATPLS